MQPLKSSGTAQIKRNSWIRGKGEGTRRGEIKKGLSMNKRILNRKVRHASKIEFKKCSYKKIKKTIDMIHFS
ncbi:hypothetical protein G3V89_23640 [Escherichia coli]|nr:hypothetical protein [Escherichia coli]